MIGFKMLDPRMTMDRLGLLPFFLDAGNPKPAKEQLDANYQHGGGWHPFNGFTLHDDNRISYSGDPDYKPLAEAKLRDELIVFYDHAWVAIIQPDRSFEICRMD